jgi:hypothetical protein
MLERSGQREPSNVGGASRENTAAVCNSTRFQRNPPPIGTLMTGPSEPTAGGICTQTDGSPPHSLQIAKSTLGATVA